MQNDFYIHAYTRNQDVTGSTYLISAHFPNKENVRLLLDAGAFQGSEIIRGYNEVFPLNLQKIKFVIISHIHMDHIGLLPVLVAQGYNNPIYMTYPSLELIDINLNDAWKIESKNYVVPRFTRENICETFNLMKGCAFKKVIKPHKNISITFFSNGHMVGAAMIEIVISYPGREDIRILFTGDYKGKNIFFPVEKLPQSHISKPYSAIFCESTYGNIDSSHEKFQPHFISDITEALKNQKKVVIPSFAIERAQELLYYFKYMQDNSFISSEIEIWLAGSTAMETTKRFHYKNLGVSSNMKNFLPKNFHTLPKTKKNVILNELFKSKKPFVIIAPGGMADYGTITSIIPYALPREDCLIYFSCYCEPNSKGYKILHTKYGEKIVYNGKPYIKKCKSKFTGELSGHAKRDEFLQLFQAMEPPKCILVGHGKMKIRKSFGQYLNNNLLNTDIEILNPDYGIELDSNGIIKTFPANFEIF